MYNLQFKTETFGGEIPFIDSQHVRWVRGGITIDKGEVTAVDGKKKLKAGAFVGKIANGKYAPYVPAVASSKVIGDPAEDVNKAVKYTAIKSGEDGDNIKIQHKDPGEDADLSVDVIGGADGITTIVVTLEYDTDAVVSTAAEVAAAVNNHYLARTLVVADVSINEDDEGAGVVAVAAATALEDGADANIGNAVILGVDVDVTDNDGVATALDHGRVIVERLPAAPDAYIKSLLPGVVWK